MTEAPETGIDPDDGFDYDFILGAPPAMPNEVWESSLSAAFNWADVDESLYPDDAASPEDSREVEALQTIYLDDNGLSGFDGGQEPEWPEDRDNDDDDF